MDREDEYENCYYRFRHKIIMYVSEIDFSEKREKKIFL